jgi:hypothetical protein
MLQHINVKPVQDCIAAEGIMGHAVLKSCLVSVLSRDGYAQCVILSALFMGECAPALSPGLPFEPSQKGAALPASPFPIRVARVSFVSLIVHGCVDTSRVPLLTLFTTCM